MRSTIDVAEAALVAAVVIVLGVTVAVLLIRGIRKRSEKRHRKISGSRRNANTHYDLLGERAEPATPPREPSSGRSRRRRRRHSTSGRGGIDILRKDDESPTES